ncbi:hypothetical protein [Rhizobium sp. BK176]|uniref:hypothetical protein n=1 Tax=Rhizobium sp. BK176 TaxID=2587071 RepID=UPI00216A40B3|nr:hypothetical protein [Rhizobium sp. BK176]MCS4091375.1 hypothetical protein [Rhizobium sp. BK176]
MHLGDSSDGLWFGYSKVGLVEKLRRLADDLENAETSTGTRVPEVFLKDWFLVQRPVPSLVGQSFGHPNIVDGRSACTSQLFFLDERRGLARTLSRWYSLGPSATGDSQFQ